MDAAILNLYKSAGRARQHTLIRAWGSLPSRSGSEERNEMPAAICDQGHVREWRNQRGVRLSAMRCAECGGALHLAKWAGYENGVTRYVRVESKGAAGPLVPCAICGRKRRAAKSNAKTLEADTVFEVWRPGWIATDPNTIRTAQVTIKAGSVICWLHNPKHVVALFDGQLADQVPA
jgi:hypothetical protein